MVRVALNSGRGATIACRSVCNRVQLRQPQVKVRASGTAKTSWLARVCQRMYARALIIVILAFV